MTWERREPREHTLPSGQVATLAPGPCIDRLLRTDMVPNMLAGLVLNDDGDADFTKMDAGEIDRREREYKAAIVCAVMIDPVVTVDPLEGAFPYDDIPPIDRDYIVAWASDGALAYAQFREERESSDDREGGEVLADDPVSAPGAGTEKV